MSRRLLLRLLGTAFGCALLGHQPADSAPAQRQARPPRPQQHTPRRTDTSPFRRIDIGDLRVDLLALNDEACPLRIASGRVGAGAGGQRVIAVDVKGLAPATLDSYTLGVLVFDAAGVFKWTRNAATGAGLPTGNVHSVDLALDYATLGTGDLVIVAVKGTGWAGGVWTSEWEEVRTAASEFAKRRR